MAIKLIQPWVGLSGSILQRFNTEREILGNLNHPNIARLLDAGVTSDEVPYLIMEYVDGLPIDDYCCHNRLSTSHRLRLFLVVCAAVEHAHQNLIVHRDIKPANILVNAEGVPKLLDFGIAKLLDPTAKDHNATRLSQRMMTLEYASPEQVCGGKITAATDVYALGVLLYELLAGHHPFQLRGKSPLEIGQIISEQRAEPPSRTIAGDAGRHPADVARMLRGDLDHIILLAMRKRPSRRYPSVAALSRDLTAYLTGYPLPTRTYSRTQRVSKYVARNKVVVLAALLMIMALIGLVVVMAMRTGRESQERGLSHTFAAHSSSQFAADFALTDL